MEEIVTSQKLSEDAQRLVASGYRNAANIFLFFVEELEARYGKKEARAIASAVVRRKGLAAGNVAANAVGRSGLRELAEAHRRFFPTTEQVEVSPARYVAEDEHCLICPAWQAAGLDAERIRELGDIYCWGDLAYAQAFNPAIQLEFDGRQAEGKPRCRWIFTLREG